MKTITTLLLLVLLCSGILFAGTPQNVTIFHVTDTHSHLLPYCSMDELDNPTKGGIARMATVLKNERAAAEQSLFFHIGDFSVGDAVYNKYRGVPELDILETLEIDALTIGNHEFDLGPDTLLSVLQRAGFPKENFPLLTANLEYADKTDLDDLIEEYSIETVGDYKIALIGLTPIMANSFSLPAPVAITSPAQATREVIDTLGDQADFVILLSHVGIYDEPALLDSLALTGHSVDLIISGHDHVPLFEPLYHSAGGKEVPIVSAGSYYDYLGKVEIKLSDEAGLEIINSELIPLDPEIPDDPEISAIVQGLRGEIEADANYGPMYTDIIAEALEPVTLAHEAGWRDTGLGNLVTDALRDTTKTDIALDVWGFLRQDICAGPLTGADIFQAVSMGYNPVTGLGYDLVTFELGGMALQLGIAFALSEALTSKDFGIQVSGIELEYTTEGGEFNISKFLIGGQPLNIFSKYTVTTTDGLAQFLYLAGISAQNLQPTGISQYAAVRDYVVKNSPIAAKAEGRIVDTYIMGVSTPKVENLPQQFVLHSNYPNPFSHSTKINFELKANTFNQHDVTVALFNLLGRQVKVLAAGFYQNGAYSLNWDGTDALGRQLPNGMYFLKLRMNSQIAVKKILLAR